MSAVFDALLGLALLATAATVFWSRDLFRAVVMFIAFGVLLSLIWVRLQAPDLALAEAAIGAGLTGVLLLDAMGHLKEHQNTRQRNPLILPLLASLTLGALVIAAIALRPVPGISLADKVAAAMPQSGVDHPITAVLLNFRSYDTLLEIAVLLVAVIVAMALNQQQQSNDTTATDPLLGALARRLLPLMLLVAAYVLWAGSSQPGGAFQGGAVVAAAGVLARMSGVSITRYTEQIWRLGLALGFLIFLAVAASTMLSGQPFLTYPQSLAGQLIFLIEAMLTLSIGVILFGLFIQAPDKEADNDH